MPEEPLSDVIVARLLKEMEGYYALDLHDEVVERANRLLDAGREVSRALTMKGRALQDEARFDEAIAVFEQLCQQDPDADTAYFGIGWCRKRGGRLDLAIAAIEELLARQPNHPLGLYNLACYLALDGQRDRPLEMLRRAIEIDDTYLDHARDETDFDALREDPEFRTIVDQKK